MPQIDFLHYPFASQLFWLIISFGVLYFVLSKIIVPRIFNIKNERETSSKSALQEAQDLKDQALKAKSESEDLANDAREKSISFYHKTEAEIAKIKSAADKRINDHSQNLETAFLHESEKEINQTKPIIKSTAIDIASFILKNNFAVEASDRELTKFSEK